MAGPGPAGRGTCPPSPWRTRRTSPASACPGRPAHTRGRRRGRTRGSSTVLLPGAQHPTTVPAAYPTAVIAGHRAPSGGGGGGMVANQRLELADWRRRVAELYAAVRAEADPEQGHARWRDGRDALFRTHPQSPLGPDDPLRGTGLPYWPYDPALRFEPPLLAAPEPVRLRVPTDGDGITTLVLAGRVELPEPLAATVDVWWLDQYAGGLFVPLRDGSAGSTSYGGGATRWIPPRAP